MNEPGVCTLWVQEPNGTIVPDPRNSTMAEREKHVVVLHVVTEHGTDLSLVFRRGELSGLLAHPNDTASCIEVAVSVEEEA